MEKRALNIPSSFDSNLQMEAQFRSRRAYRLREARDATLAHQVQCLSSAGAAAVSGARLTQVQVAKVCGISMLKLRGLTRARKQFIHKHVPLSKNPQLIATIGQVIVKRGLHQLSLREVLSGLKAHDLPVTPCPKTVASIMN